MINTLFLTTVAVEPTFVAFHQHSPTYVRGLSCHSFKFLWRTGQTKPPTIPFGIVACTFSDNLSRNSCIPFFTKKQYPFRTPSIDKWYPFHLPCLEHCIPFNYCKCTVSSIGINHKNRTFSRLYKAIKFICYPFWTLPRTQMTDLPTLC